MLRKGHPALQPLAEPTGTRGDSGTVTAGVPRSHPTRVGIPNPHPRVPPAGYGALGMEGWLGTLGCPCPMAPPWQRFGRGAGAGTGGGREIKGKERMGEAGGGMELGGE